MDCIKGKLIKQKEEERFSFFLENGRKLLEGILASSDGKYDVPYRNFRAKELIKATTNFKDYVMYDASGNFYRGSFQERPILVKMVHDRDFIPYVINDIVVSLQMSHHKNVFKLLGCCLEFKIPAIVYEYAGNTRLLTDILHRGRDESSSKADDDEDGSLSWKIRLKLAVDISNALVYLHSAFATPIIHRDLCARNIIVCSDGVAKLLNFSLCISLPPGESQVEDTIIGQIGYVEPEYMSSGIITEKTDVYMFGVLLLELLTGEKPINPDRKSYHLIDHVKDHVVKNQVYRVLDPILLAEKEGPEEEHNKLQQMQAFADLALRCTQPANDRPDMITVAKELMKIKKSLHLR